MKLASRIGVVLFLTTLCFANTPGKHQVALNWNASTTTGATYKVYRGSSAGVCNGTPTPYADNITGTSFLDTNVALGTTYFYNVSAFTTTGGESTCDGEVQVPVPNITTVSPTGLQGVSQ